MKHVLVIEDWEAFKVEWQQRASKYSGFLDVDSAIESLEETISPGNLLAEFKPRTIHDTIEMLTLISASLQTGQPILVLILEEEK